MTTHTTPDDQPLTPTTDPAAELAALYPLMMKAGCWPEEIALAGTIGANYCFTPNGFPEHDIGPGPWFRIMKRHALAIVRYAVVALAVKVMGGGE